MAAMNEFLTDTAKEAFLVANTPSFLFRRLRDDSCVRHIAQTNTTADIQKWFANNQGMPNEVDDLIMRYVYLVALSRKDNGEVRAVIRDLPLSGMEWGTAITALIENQPNLKTPLVLMDSGKPRQANSQTSNSSGAITILPSGVLVLSKRTQ